MPYILLPQIEGAALTPNPCGGQRCGCACRHRRRADGMGRAAGGLRGRDVCRRAAGRSIKATRRSVRITAVRFSVRAQGSFPGRQKHAKRIRPQISQIQRIAQTITERLIKNGNHASPGPNQRDVVHAERHGHSGAVHGDRDRAGRDVIQQSGRLLQQPSRPSTAPARPARPPRRRWTG